MPRWFKRCLPQTIFWRLAWLTAIALLLSVLFALALFNYSRQQIIADQAVEQISEVLASLEDDLDGLTPTERDEWLDINRRPYAPHLLPFQHPDTPTATRLRSSQNRLLARVLRERLDTVGDIRETPPPKRQLWVEVRLLGERWWLVVPLGRFRAASAWPVWASILIFALAALAVAALFAWRINQPLRELRAAAARLGQGERPEPLPETGPLEVRDLSISFNRMLADLDTSERERAIMLAGISHDLRTPLARLKLGVEMMSDTSLQDGMREDVEDIERILGQFLDFVRGLGDEAPQLSDPAELARGVATRYARAGHSIEIDLADTLVPVLLRPLALQRALGNLLDNAIRYGAAPWVLRVSPHAGELHFSVIDHGNGIPAELLAAARQPFQRLDSARRADGGSGLGMAIVERIARMHGGRLDLVTEDGLTATLVVPASPPATK
ncbi:ATP-binding protein [Chitinimonas sp. BJYL2]|uniref:ATP-binding protein n=1 Tax=Chitinimonas sp. BJYL2 TaxID=2976696 RepID=UPI0022B55DEC|nr:ATP-binding protein [Chitinimonas sp. BJYL2]